jgi:hexosaminidase
MKDRFSTKRSIAISAVVAAAVAMLVAIPAQGALASPATLPVVPTVQSVTTGSGNFTIGSGSRIVVDTATAGSSTSGVTAPLLVGNTLTATANNAVAAIQAVTGVSPAVVSGTSPSAGDIYIKLAANGSLGTEGYTEAITSSVTISAPTTAGVYYGIQSLLQQLKSVSGHTTTPQVSISDYPSVGFRGVMLDVGRRYWPVADIIDEIRRMSWNKLNVLQLHLNEDEAFRLSLGGSYSGLNPTSDASNYSHADINEILDAAKANNITVIPEIDTPAHALPIALAGGSDRSLGPVAKCGSHYSQDIDLTDSTIRSWAVGLYTAVAAWFPGPYFHIGGDEVEQLDACPYIQATGKTGAQLQTDYANQIDNALTALGKTSMMWAGNTDILPNKDIIFTDFGHVDGTLRGLGYDVVDQPGTVSSGMPDIYTSTNPDLYSYNPPTGTHAVGPLLANWADAQSSGSDSNFTLRETVAKQTLVAERSWNSAATTISWATWQAKVNAAGDAPNARALTVTPVTTNGKPVHRYEFDSLYSPPNNSQFYSPMWNAATGPVRVGEDQSWADSAGSLFAIAQYGKPTVVAGRSGNALQFNTSVDSGTFATIADGDNPASWTVAAWVKRTANDGVGDLISNHFAAIRVEQYGTSQHVGVTQFGVADYSFSYSVPLNTWTHLAIVSDGTAGTTTLYANGVSQGSIAHVVDFPVATIGGKHGSVYAGQLDQLTIYNQALTSTQVGNDYNGTTTTSKISTGATATATSIETPAFPASYAIDNDYGTRWSSAYSDPQDLVINFGSTKSISRMELTWQAAYAATYQIDVSPNGTTWTPAVTGLTGHIGFQSIENINASGQYVRVHCLTRALPFGDSLFDVSVFGS